MNCLQPTCQSTQQRQAQRIAASLDLGHVALLQTIHASGFHVPSATPQRGNFSLRVAAVSLRQTESPPRFGGLPMSVQMANQVHAAINHESNGASMFSGRFS